MSNLAIITARGGSKRIPKKNIKDFCGKPIISYAIKAAVESGIFDDVMVSTDDNEIADISRKYGVSVPFMRSAKNSDDYSGTSDVLIEVVREFEKIGRIFTTVCCIYPTAPFVTAEKLIEAYDKFETEGADAIIPVVQFSYPPQRCFVATGGLIKYKWPKYEKSRSQDLEPLYHDAGQFYFIKTDVLIAQKTLVPANTVPFKVDELEVQDIDNVTDWKMAELKYKLMRGI